VAKEVEEANRAAEAAREAERLEREQAREAERLEREKEMQQAAQRRFEQEQIKQLQDQVSQKLESELRQVQQATKQLLIKDLQDQRRLEQEGGLAKQMEFLTRQETQLKQHHATLDKAITEMKDALERAKEAKKSGGDSQQSHSVDDLCVPATALDQQMLDLSAQNAALADALYFLDRALQKGSIDLQVHLKHVRQLSKKQFLVRAHLEKIEQRK
jgi:ESCRT-I complex subunit TSG101